MDTDVVGKRKAEQREETAGAELQVRLSVCLPGGGG